MIAGSARSPSEVPDGACARAGSANAEIRTTPRPNHPACCRLISYSCSGRLQGLRKIECERYVFLAMGVIASADSRVRSGLGAAGATIGTAGSPQRMRQVEMRPDVSLGRLDADEPANTNLLSCHVPEAFHNVFGQCGFNRRGDDAVFSDGSRQDVVIGYA